MEGSDKEFKISVLDFFSFMEISEEITYSELEQEIL